MLKLALQINTKLIKDAHGAIEWILRSGVAQVGTSYNWIDENVWTDANVWKD